MSHAHGRELDGLDSVAEPEAPFGRFGWLFGPPFNRPILNGLSVRATSKLVLVNGFSHYWFQYLTKSWHARGTLEIPLEISV